MDKPCAVTANYMDFAFKRGLKVARVTLEMPIEQSKTFLDMFGTPDGANPVHVAIARLSPATEEPEPVKAPAEPAQQPSKRSFRDMPRSQQAALKLQDDVFCRWLYDHPNADGYVGKSYDDLLKHVLNIVSKTDLDRWPEAGANWDKLLASFDYRDRA